MDLFSFPPIAAVFNAAYALVEGLTALFTPIAGVGAAAVAIIVFTALVRTAARQGLGRRGACGRASRRGRVIGAANQPVGYTSSTGAP